ncbi:hypothetical protein HKD37_04G010105 [Glycine soja]
MSEMKKLARKFHNEEDENLPLPIHNGDSRPLDPQDHICNSILLLHRVSFVLHLPVGFISVGTALFLLFSEFYNIEYVVPFVVLDKQQYHAYFMEEIYSWMIIFAACSFAIMGLLDQSMHHRRWIHYS